MQMRSALKQKYHHDLESFGYIEEPPTTTTTTATEEQQPAVNGCSRAMRATALGIILARAQ